VDTLGVIHQNAEQLLRFTVACGTMHVVPNSFLEIIFYDSLIPGQFYHFFTNPAARVRMKYHIMLWCKSFRPKFNLVAHLANILTCDRIGDKWVIA
jgi:hypothetical protein